jgi:hypothetical protein
MTGLDTFLARWPWKDTDPRERTLLAGVFFVAATVIGLEIVTFQALSFVNDYMRATQVLSVALLGIAVGGLASYFLGRFDRNKVCVATLALFPLAVVASFPIVIRLNAQPALMMALLTVPYVLASIYLSLAFNALRPGLVYLFDLVGAGVGAILAVAAIPLLREEGSFLVFGLIGAWPLFLEWRRGRGERHGRFALTAGVLLSLAGVVLLVLHVATDPFNMLRIATADPKEVGGKLFLSWYDGDGQERHNLLYSKGSLIERIDIIQTKGRKGQWASVYNGRIVDLITGERSKIGRLDNRMPTLLKADQDPDTLLVGPSGQGLCKAIQALGEGHVDAVEINGAIAGLMLNEMYERSGEAYAGFDVTVGDVRTFLERTDRKYDFITMLNTHRIWSMGHEGPPEYVHTLEAMRAYLDHLKDDGFIIFEERNINERADLGIRRILYTAKAALREAGISDPAKHLAVWELYHGCNKRQWFSDPQQCRRRQLFTFVAIKRTPITDAEYEHFLEWAELLGERKPGKDGDYRGILWRYLPQAPTDHYWTEVVTKDDPFAVAGTDRDLHNMGVITDDVPFPFDVFQERETLTSILEDVVMLALLMVLLPGIVTFLARRREDGGRAAPSRRLSLLTNGLMIFYFAVLGIGYLLIEVVLIQKFGIFLSSPVWSMVVVLATMLIASGIGGWRSLGIGRGGALLALAAVVAITALYWFVLDPVLGGLMFLPFPLRVAAAAVLLAPLAYFMGMPFPWAMGLAKERLTDRHAGLFFGINGALAAVATPVSIIISMNHGFGVTILAGGAAYVLCLALLAAVPRTRPTEPEPAEQAAADPLQAQPG